MATFGLQLTQTPNLILVRRVIHRRIAVVQLVTTALTTVVAVALAWMGVTLWALLATDIAALCVQIVLFYIWRPVWRPRLAWDASVVRYYLRFGSRTFLAGVLLQAINHVDDLWTGQVLGKTALGFYSRAYTFATYPRQVLAQPINAVAAGTYAELKGNRKGLSQAFFRTNAFLIRTGFFLAGLLALLAPEFIQLLLGAKWMPMLEAFRLMLVFTLLDPIKTTVADLFTAVGRPELVVRARSIQLMVLLGGLLLLGRPFGIAGVALAVNVMLIVGIVLLFWQARAYVDLSLWRLFGAPSLALACGLGLGSGAAAVLPIGTWDLWAGLTKALVFAGGYGLVSWAFERKEILRGFQLLVDYIGAPRKLLAKRFERRDR
jgi:O-antigen/teichoic acid export membrane protein